MKIVVDEVVFEGNWNDIIRLYDAEKNCALPRTNLSYAAVYPSPIDLQNVALMVQVFNEKNSCSVEIGWSNFNC